MKEKILAKILSYLLSDWKNNILKINDVDIILHAPAYSPMQPYITIDKMKFGAPEISALYYSLMEYQNANAIKIKEEKVKEIYNKICIDKEL